jgi:hypothetical protein
MGEYEFSVSENEVVGRLGRRAQLWGGLSVAGGALCLLGALLAIRIDASSTTTLFLLFAALPQLSVGMSFLGAGRSLVGVVETQGHDVALLMDALRRLTVALRIQIGITVVFVLLMAALAAGVPALK